MRIAPSTLRPDRTDNRHMTALEELPGLEFDDLAQSLALMDYETLDRAWVAAIASVLEEEAMERGALKRVSRVLVVVRERMRQQLKEATDG